MSFKFVLPILEFFGIYTIYSQLFDLDFMPVFYQFFEVVEFVFWVPMILVQIRRYHDVGRSGWWYLASVLPLWLWDALVRSFLFQYEMTDTAIFLFKIIFGVSIILALISVVLLFFKSEPGPNRWGPNPKDEIECLKALQR